jgi:hypothetical protein
MATVTAVDILAALACGKRGCACGRAAHQGRGMTHCPAHADGAPSLAVAPGDKGADVVFHDHAGCPWEAIRDALVARGLWGATGLGSPSPAATAANGRTSAGKSVRHELRSLDGQVVAVHCREVDGTTGKKLSGCWWELPDGTRGLGGTRTEDLPLFGSETLGDLPDGAEVIVVEGEPARVALAWSGISATATVTGAGTIPSDVVLGCLVRLGAVLGPDADDPGREHMERIAARLVALSCPRVELVEWSEAPARGDARDFITGLQSRGLPREEMAAAVGVLPRRPWSPPGPASLSALSALIAQPAVPWPELDSAALHGLAGEVVAAVDPHTEADPVAVLVSFLVAFGNAVGDGPHVVVGATDHPARDFAGLVGETSRARKGDSWSAVRRLMARAAPEWADARVQGGLSSGEGLVAAVRDPVEQPDKKTGEIITIEAGVEDKRLLVVESELARTLRVMRRDGSTLSAILRDAWDTGSLRVMTKTPTKATGAHVSVVGHVTQEELRRELDETSLANGFANRFLWLAVRRSKRLPEPEPLGGSVVDRLAAKIAEAIRFAHGLGAIPRDDEARRVWAEVYPDLTADRPGLLGAVLSRCEAHAVRLSLIYALLDQSSVVRREHLLAALALIDYAEASAQHIFGDRLGDPVADATLAALAERGEMSRNAVRDLFGRHVSAPRIATALDALVATGRVATEKRETGGRPVEVWRLR